MSQDTPLKRMKLTYTHALWLLYACEEHPTLQVELRQTTPQLRLLDAEQQLLAEAHLPWVFPPVHYTDNQAVYSPLPTLESFSQYVERLPQGIPPHIILLIQAGNAALGYIEDGDILHHKVIRKYMVRKKQGKAQVTHLNQKGKSRLGSRIRLANTKAFFEEIHDKLVEWDVVDNADIILYSCPTKLWSLLYDAKTTLAWQREDPRLQKIPTHVHTPNFDELQRIQTLSTQATLDIYTPALYDMLPDL
ncbi:MAG TPA: hypothetical protein DCE42_12170 [Myxococcales bacterium]|mgnify:CR=1 FL=1|nr:hypothetical protein [Deltaproteobacteria bacterium]MBU52867.1 hypothetical protein [Deltaproteobacteria bacterium]HAA55507.1 hypothetical protein [Myxococcales bacterium]|tara:strand:- start:7885 stop:8628 length:744 start_codon:yes stop_codon:yes gene_type:complete